MSKRALTRVICPGRAITVSVVPRSQLERCPVQHLEHHVPWAPLLQIVFALEVTVWVARHSALGWSDRPPAPRGAQRNLPI